MLADCGQELLERALWVLKACPEECDASCYRCLRSYKNKIEHSLLDRHAGAELVEYLVTGKLPRFDARRLRDSTVLPIPMIFCAKVLQEWSFKLDAPLSGEASGLNAPILATTSTGNRFIIALSGPLTSDHPVDPVIAEYRDNGGTIPVIVENELVVRGNLPSVTNAVRRILEA